MTDKIFSLITQVTNPQGIMAIIEKSPENQEIDYTQDIIVALDSAKLELARQSSLLLEMGEEEMAKNYSERVKIVENFINTSKKQNGNK